jgi:hypothetical protein
VCPGRFTASYLLLLAIQRGYEAQAAAVDWILGKDWPADAADGLVHGGPGGPADAPNSSLGYDPALHDAHHTSSMDTQQLLGHDVAEALQLADTATSCAQQVQRQQATHAQQQHVHVSPSPIPPAGNRFVLLSGHLPCLVVHS